MMEPVAHIVIKPNGKRSVTLATQYDPMSPDFWLGGERAEGYEVEPLVRLSDAEARIRELEAALAGMTAKAERQWAGWVKAEALLKEAREQRDTWTDNDRAKAWRDVFDSMHQRAMTAEAKLTQLLSYVPEECYEGDDRWELVKCNRSGGAWFGAEDFRAARAISDKIGVKDE